jgi:hypothetical protein
MPRLPQEKTTGIALEAKVLEQCVRVEYVAVHAGIMSGTPGALATDRRSAFPRKRRRPHDCIDQQRGAAAYDRFGDDTVAPLADAARLLPRARPRHPSSTRGPVRHGAEATDLP